MSERALALAAIDEAFKAEVRTGFANIADYVEKETDDKFHEALKTALEMRRRALTKIDQILPKEKDHE